MRDLSPLRDRIAQYRAQLAQGIPLTDAQLEWLMRAIELQCNVIDASDAYSNELEISNLKKGIEIHELKESLKQYGHDSPRN